MTVLLHPQFHKPVSEVLCDKNIKAVEVKDETPRLVSQGGRGFSNRSFVLDQMVSTFHKESTAVQQTHCWKQALTSVELGFPGDAGREAVDVEVAPVEGGALGLAERHLGRHALLGVARLVLDTPPHAVLPSI